LRGKKQTGSDYGGDYPEESGKRASSPSAENENKKSALTRRIHLRKTNSLNLKYRNRKKRGRHAGSMDWFPTTVCKQEKTQPALRTELVKKEPKLGRKQYIRAESKRGSRESGVGKAERSLGQGQSGSAEAPIITQGSGGRITRKVAGTLTPKPRSR